MNEMVFGTTILFSPELIRQELNCAIDHEFRIFSERLLPGTDNILGVRFPRLRTLAKSIVRKDWREYLSTASDDSFEEVMLQGMVIGYAEADIEEILNYIKYFIPKICNWSLCDSFCSGLKLTNVFLDKIWIFIQPYLKSSKEFEVRFGVVMLIFYFINDMYLKEVLDVLDSIYHKGYYVKMAVAWAVSICYISFPKETMSYLKDNSLDDWTYNKALQKIRESLHTSKTEKIKIKDMKRIEK